MARSSSSFPLAFTILYAALGAWCIGLIIFGAARLPESLGLACLAVGLLGAIVVAASLPIAWILQTGPGAGESRPTASASTERLLSQIYENSMLSDNAKRVLFRERELNLLRAAIEEDIARGDYNAGITLCEEMANVFGHREEAETFRSRIVQAGHASYESKVREAMAEFDRILVMRDWAKAHREAGRIRRLYPNHHLVQEIDARIMAAREEHKRELEAQFLDAANRDDVDTAMAMLKHLDRYLTREEAARVAEVAQGVVIKHRDNLSMQFKLAVNDHRWSEAAQVGDMIIAEYPNTKMADEVRSMIDVLRVRASQAAVLAQG